MRQESCSPDWRWVRPAVRCGGTLGQYGRVCRWPRRSRAEFRTARSGARPTRPDGTRTLSTPDRAKPASPRIGTVTASFPAYQRVGINAANPAVGPRATSLSTEPTWTGQGVHARPVADDHLPAVAALRSSNDSPVSCGAQITRSRANKHASTLPAPQYRTSHRCAYASGRLATFGDIGLVCGLRHCRARGGSVGLVHGQNDFDGHHQARGLASRLLGALEF